MNSRKEINKQIEMHVSDAIIAKPVRFRAGKRSYSIYPPALGKIQILKNLYLSMGMDALLPAAGALEETMRLSREHPRQVCRVIAYSTFDDKQTLLNAEKVEQRARLFEDALTVRERATLLALILTNDKTEEFIRYFGIDADRELRGRISRLKDGGGGSTSGGSLTFGGKSIYGLLIDFACQRYGWTMDYVVWGISYTNLSMLFADAVTTVYLSDEERRQLGVGFGEVIDADDPANRELVREMISE